MVKYKVSLHSHTTNFKDANFFFNDSHKNFDALMSRLSKVKGNIVLGLSNFNDDNRYEKMINFLIKNHIKGDYKFKDYFVTLQKDGRKIHFVKTDEIETSKGHILIIGYKGKVIVRELSKVLENASEEKAIVIFNHPLHKKSFLEKIFRFIFGKRRISLNEKAIRKYFSKVDALELNPYFYNDWGRVKKISKAINKPLVADSDAHFINEVFDAYYEVNNLDFSSPLAFKDSLRREIKKGVVIHTHKNGTYRFYKHVFGVLTSKVIDEIGLR